MLVVINLSLYPDLKEKNFRDNHVTHWVLVKQVDANLYTAMNPETGQTSRTLSGEVWWADDPENPFLINDLQNHEESNEEYS